MKQNITDILHDKTKLPKEEIEKLIEIPPRTELGDYSFPCFILSNPKNYDDMWKDVEKDFFTKKSPVEIANHLKDLINSEKLDEIEKIDSKGPYLNFYVNKKQLIKNVLAKALKIDYGAGKEKQKILLEHTSINPNASPHVGRARNSIIGDSIYRILSFQGNKVERHYYVNDVSKQIAMLALNFKKGDTFQDMLQRYIEISNKVAKSPELEKQVFELLEKFEHGDKKITALFKKIVDLCVNGQKKIFSNFGIEFDYFDYESKYIGKPSQDILKKLKKTGKLFEDKEGRLVLDQSNTHLTGKMRAPYFVLARSNGTSLYPLRDLSYTLEKMKHGKNIIILGEDHKLYFEQISEALKILGHKAPEAVHYSFVLLQTDSGTKKMSTRRGELVLLEDFYDVSIKKANAEIKKRETKGDAHKISIGAIKYAMLRNDNEKNINFSWEQSLNFEGESGPYLQYAYARASSILKKSRTNKKFKIPEQPSKSEFTLIKKIAEFPEVIKDASKKLNPSIVANYSFTLAKTFNEFYHNNKVIGSNEEPFRLKLIEAFRITIKNSLYLLGIETMEEM
ncbi:MAG: arginine--tRNA ligase [Nanoarchaeota archaeon]|nr:arginine--tRNA ligase [Nanoarchaeota archaeon]